MNKNALRAKLSREYTSARELALKLTPSQRLSLLIRIAISLRDATPKQLRGRKALLMTCSPTGRVYTQHAIGEAFERRPVEVGTIPGFEAWQENEEKAKEEIGEGWADTLNQAHDEKHLKPDHDVWCRCRHCE